MEFLASMHPRLVHFPMALLSVYILFELLYVVTNKEYFAKGAHIILFLGILGALAAVLTGNQAEKLIEKLVPHSALKKHEDFANFTLWYFFFILVARTYFTLKKKFTKKIQVAVLLFAAIGLFLLYQTGEYGGKLVYKYGAGTELLKNGK